MARRAKIDAEKTRAKILSNALSLFVKKGYENTTFIDIAARLKMTKGAVYWHFDSKSGLLTALIEEATLRFSTALREHMEGREMTFPAVAEMLVEMAQQIISDRSRADFFMLMLTGVKWTDAKLAELARKLIAERSGPYHAVVDALTADVESGRVCDSADVEALATTVMSIWDGVIRRKIEGFMTSDVTGTLDNAFNLVWNGIKTR